MKTVNTTGKRKRAIAKATLKEGTGKVTMNRIELSNIKPDVLRLKLSEPLLLAEKLKDKVDVNIRASGGGMMSQIEAARLALARALVEYSKDEKLKSSFINYDRHLLIADVRRKEMCKPNDSKARAKRQKSYR
tara:strand:+ start:840 stop:1238 length:399 start_codon:yes stop_codon:yes gene_type:complete